MDCRICKIGSRKKNQNLDFPERISEVIGHLGRSDTIRIAFLKSTSKLEQKREDLHSILT
eukprot:5900451-Prorocentrum_lima.AAC.1